MTIYKKYKKDIETHKGWGDVGDVVISNIKQSYLNAIDCIREHLNDGFDDEDNLQDDMNLGILAQKGKTDIYLQEQRKLIEND